MVKSPLPGGSCRQDFPILKRTVHGKPLIYLDNAATSQKPKHVLAALTHYYTHSNANIHRGIHTLSEEATLAYEESHQKAACFLGAHSMKEIVFTRNTTESLNLLAYSLSLKKGDEIVLTRMEHHSNIVPWLALAERTGARIRYLEMNKKTGELLPIEKTITPKTKIVSVVHASNVLGTINPVKKIAAAAHAVGAVCIVDGAQSAPHMPIDVRSLGCDFFACSSHKMCGPTGIGVLYGRQELLDELPPFQYGGDMIREVRYNGATWNDLPWKFEAGTPDVGGAVAFGAALDYLSSFGMEKIQRHGEQLVRYTRPLLEAIPSLTILGPTQRTPLLSFTVDGAHPHDIATILDHHGIAVRAGHHCAMPLATYLGINGTTRASFYLYNTEAEIDTFVTVLKKAVNVFRKR